MNDRMASSQHAPDEPASDKDARDRLIGIACGILAALIWGGGAVVSRHLVTSDVQPLDLAMLRYAGACPLAAAIMLVWQRKEWLSWSWRRTAVLIALAGPPYHLLVIAGYEYAPAGAGTLLVSGLLPLLAFALALALKDGSAKTARPAAAMTMLVGGLALLGCEAGGADDASIGLVSVIIFTTAACLWAVLNQTVERWRLCPLDLTLMLSVTAPLFLPLYWLSSKQGLQERLSIADAVLQIGYHGLLVGIAATYLFFVAILRAGPRIAAALQALAPAAAVLFGHMALSEPLSGTDLLATMLIVSGIATAALACRPRKISPKIAVRA